MTHKNDSNIPDWILEEINQNGFDSVPKMIESLVNTAMKAQREEYLGAKQYERTERRIGHANGYKPKTVKTRNGELTFSIPQVREGGFYPSALEKGQRSEKALKLAIAEMYLLGVSTRKVSRIMKEIFEVEISAAAVSEAVEKLDKILEAWRNAPIEEIPYLYVDARYEKIREDGVVKDAAVLIAFGIQPNGRRRILGTSVSISEREEHWREFFESLVRRGLRGVQLIISDAHPGLNAARRAVFGGVSWQRCVFHLMQNAQAFVQRKDMQAEVNEDLRRIFNAPDRNTAETYLRQAVEKYARKARRLSEWMEENLPEGLTFFSFPVLHRRFLRTNNAAERLNREIRRRTRVVGIFPNTDSCLRLISAILMEISEEWECGRIYLNLKE